MFRLHSEQPCDYAGVFDAPLGTTLRMLVGMLMVYQDPIPEPAGSGFGFCGDNARGYFSETKPGPAGSGVLLGAGISFIA